MNPYRLDLEADARHRVINFSGGRSSGFMLAQIVDAHGGRIPDYATVVFTNTGKEREETLDFIKACEAHFGVEVVRAEYRFRPQAKGGIADPRHAHVVVGHEDASRDGEPFRQLIASRKMLPNVTMRFCTSELKVRTVERYMTRDLGIKRADFINILGIRHDEPRRWRKAMIDGCKVDYPMVVAQATIGDVMRFWRDMPFDLALKPDEGNCDLCFLKGKAKLIRLVRDNPGAAQWWIDMEAIGSAGTVEGGLRNDAMARFRERYSYADLVEIAQTQPELPFPDFEEQPISCFCGD